MSDTSTIKPEDCPEPYWHETHRYCPACSYAEPPCGAQHPTRGGVVCDQPRDHTQPHSAKVQWAK